MKWSRYLVVTTGRYFTLPALIWYTEKPWVTIWTLLWWVMLVYPYWQKALFPFSWGFFCIFALPSRSISLVNAQRKISASEESSFLSPHPLSDPGQSQKSWFYAHCQRLLGLSVELRAHCSPFLQWCHLPFWFLSLLSDQQISCHIIVVLLEVIFLLCM